MSIMKKFLTLVLILFLIPGFFLGCWDYQELNQLAIVVGIAFDKAEDPDKVLMTFQVLVPKGLNPESGTGPQFLNVTATGNSVLDTIRNCTTKLDRRLYFPFNEIIIFSQDLAKEGIGPYLDFFIRNPNPRIQIWLLIAEDQARDVLEEYPSMIEIPARALSQTLERQKNYLSKIPTHYVDEFARTLNCETREGLIGIIEVKGEKKEKEILLSDTAVFRKDKIVGRLNRCESRGYLWIIGEVKSGAIVIEDPNDESAKISLEIIDSHAKTTAEIVDNQLIMKVEISMESNLFEQQGHSKISDQKILSSLEKRQATVIKNEIIDVVKKAQELNVDIFGFGDEFLKKYPKEVKQRLKNWNDHFPQVKIIVEVDSNIRRSGFLDQPLKIK